MEYYSEKDKANDIASDLHHKHTPDSVKESAEREMRRRGYSEREICDMWNTGRDPRE